MGLLVMGLFDLKSHADSLADQVPEAGATLRVQQNDAPEDGVSQDSDDGSQVSEAYGEAAPSEDFPTGREQLVEE
jgi:hypothetical protein